jgi:radical SAM protein with 4Fe4S-binding SPASM domain
MSRSPPRAGRCQAAGIGCYQGGRAAAQPNMSFEDFKVIVKQCDGRVNQFALGGRGDPDRHEHFAELVEYCSGDGIIANFTTSGYGLDTDDLPGYWRFGAVAVSWHGQDYTLKAIELLQSNCVKTNSHYGLSDGSIDEAIRRLERSDFPTRINAVIFLLHKPVGLGSPEGVLKPGDPRVKRFFELVDRGGYPFKLGIDSCTAPGVVNYCRNVLTESIDTCEAGRFSCYIGPDMMMSPCSFDREGKYAVSLRDHTIEEAWNSKQFEDFRNKLRGACKGCGDRLDCMGGCPLMPEVVLCDRAERQPSQ